MRNLLLILTVYILFTGLSFAVEELTTIRVGISNSSFSTYEHSSANFTPQGFASVVDMETGVKSEIEPNSVISVKFNQGLFEVVINNKTTIRNAKGPLVITSPDKIGIIGLKRKGDPAYYRGMIELKAINDSKFNIINVLHMQNYLKGVVPNEMPVSFGLEALKAQAVAARNYANRPTNVYKNYDVCDSTACQVYYGANSQTEISDRAVDETLGIYAMHNNDFILALYSSTPSGMTEDYFNTFGNFMEHKPYLTSVSDTKHLISMNDEKYFKTSPPSFDMKSPKYRWEREYSASELENVLSKTLFEQSKTGNVFPAPSVETKIKDIKEIKILNRSNSKKVLSLEIRTKSGTYTVKKELPIRRVFKQNGQILPSANFMVENVFEDEKQEETNSNTNTNKEIVFDDSTDTKNKDLNILEKLKIKEKLPSKFKFYGAGFGHGVGMSQYGAGFLASYGIPYENILKHYYKGITLGTVPKIVSYNNVGIYYAQEFYFSKSKKQKTKYENPAKSPLKNELEELLNKSSSEKCYLVIENPDKVSSFEFSINDYIFNPMMHFFNTKTLKTDITPYLNDGVNRIVFTSLNEKDKRKTFKFYITLGENDE